MVKRKISVENRAFQILWETEYTFIDIGEKPMYQLNCGANVVALKEYNLRGHYETKRKDKYKYLTAELKQRREHGLNENLILQQTFSTKVTSQSEAAVKEQILLWQRKSQNGIARLTIESF